MKSNWIRGLGALAVCAGICGSAAAADQPATPPAGTPPTTTPSTARVTPVPVVVENSLPVYCYRNTGLIGRLRPVETTWVSSTPVVSGPVAAVPYQSRRVVIFPLFSRW